MTSKALLIIFFENLQYVMSCLLRLYDPNRMFVEKPTGIYLMLCSALRYNANNVIVGDDKVLLVFPQLLVKCDANYFSRSTVNIEGSSKVVNVFRNLSAHMCREFSVSLTYVRLHFLL